MSNWYGGWFVPFRPFVFSPRNNATRKNEKTPGKKMKRRNNATRKRRNNETCHTKSRNFNMKKRDAKRRHLKLSICYLFVWPFSSFRVALFRLFAWRSFVFLRGLISSFRTALFQSFHFLAWRLFVFFAWRYFGSKRRNGTNQPP